MKKATPKILLMLCIVLAAALVASLIALVAVKDEVDASSSQVQILMERVQTLEEENRALQLQLSFENAVQVPLEPETEEYYCSLMVDTWTIEENVLTVNTFAQAVLPENAKSSAQIELWCGSAVLASQPIILDIGEADGVFEADATVKFEIPGIGADEELQLWLIVESVGCDTLFACGAGWYLEDGQLMLITG